MLLTPDEAMRALGVSWTRLASMRRAGKLPEPQPYGNCQGFFRRADVRRVARELVGG
jgi:hypothetical protein